MWVLGHHSVVLPLPPIDWGSKLEKETLQNPGASGDLAQLPLSSAVLCKPWRNREKDKARDAGIIQAAGGPGGILRFGVVSAV